MEQNGESQIRDVFALLLMTKAALQWGKESFQKKILSQLHVHMKPDTYLTQISIPEGMHDNMQEKNDKISIRYSWRMFL